MRLAREIDVDAPAAAVWERIGDPSSYPRLMRDVTRWDPAPSEPGAPLRYHIEVRIRSIELGSEVEIVTSSPPNELDWKSVSGIRHHGGWRVRERDGASTVTLSLGYGAPGGVLGRVADLAAIRYLRNGIQESLERLKADVENRRIEEGARSKLTALAREGVVGGSVLLRSGLVRPMRPDRLARGARALLRFDVTFAGGCDLGAALHPGDTAIVDEWGTLSFAQLGAQTNALARALREQGVGADDRIAIMCRNHRGFVEATVAASKLGADAIFLNTGVAPPQAREILRRERPAVVIHDEEFTAGATVRGLRRFIAWHDDPDAAHGTTLDELIAAGDARDLDAPDRHGRVVLLTSGTTGAPRGAARAESASLAPVISLLDRMPLRARGVTHIASPMFHSWGYAHLGLALALSSTIVLRRRFDPEASLAAVARHRADALVVPTMLERMLALPDAVRRRHDTSSLRVVAASGSALQGELATRFMEEFGGVLYNLYGSTEVAWVAIAGPADLRAAPGTAGWPPRGTRVVIYDAAGRPAEAGEVGRIFAGNEMSFAGYTDGRGKEMIDGLMSTGDVGHLDDAGRLFVDGRADDMIVSGGENVFPSEVEDVLARHPGVAEVAVVGVSDERFGERLKAYVVRAGGAPPVSARSLKDAVRSTLAPFKVPRDVEFVTKLPRNETGKVVKRGLEPEAPR